MQPAAVFSREVQVGQDVFGGVLQKLGEELLHHERSNRQRFLSSADRAEEILGQLTGTRFLRESIWL